MSHENEVDNRLKEIQIIWKTNQWLYGIFGFGLGICIYPLTQIIQGNNLLAEIAPNIFELAFTVLIIDQLIKRRETTLENKFLKERILAQISTQDPTLTKDAISTLRHRGWLVDGTLQGQNLNSAQLSSVDLDGANFQNASLINACLNNKTRLTNSNLKGANLLLADLSNSWLHNSNLENVNLRQATLRETDLTLCNLTNANLTDADLTNADLRHSNLYGATMFRTRINGIRLNHKTVLPNGELWTETTNLTDFTHISALK